MAISRYTNPIQNTLEQYVPLPFDEMLKAGQMIQQRGDLAEQQQMQVQTGLASMEAYAPGHAKFRDSFVNNYKSEASKLLDKYQSNTSNPEFIRDMKKLNLQYGSDPRLQTIKMGNELYKQNQQIAAKMKAEGKLFIQPQFTGVDANGNLTADVPGVTAVNTLDEWTNAAKIAHESMEDIGSKTTNARNLQNWKKSVQSDGAGQAKLKLAYMQQGMSPEQAEAAVKTNIQSLVSSYGKVEKTNLGLLSYGLQERQFAQQTEDRAEDRKLKRAIAASKISKNQADAANPFEMMPTVRDNKNGFSTTTTEDKGSQFVPTFGSSTINKPVDIGGGKMPIGGGQFYMQNNKTENSYNGILRKQTGPADIKKGVDEGIHNVAVTPNGDVITSKTKGEFVMKNGKQYYKTKDSAKMIEAKPMSMRVITDRANGNIFYAPVTQHEAMRSMGASGAYWPGKKTVLESYGYKASGSAPIPKDIQSLVNSFDLTNPNVGSKIASVGGQRGYSPDVIQSVFDKAKAGQPLKPQEAVVVDNILTDLKDMSDYYKFNKGEFDNQGKLKNIYSDMFKQANGSAYTAGTVDEQTNLEEE